MKNKKFKNKLTIFGAFLLMGIASAGHTCNFFSFMCNALYTMFCLGNPEEQTPDEYPDRRIQVTQPVHDSKNHLTVTAGTIHPELSQSASSVGLEAGSAPMGPRAIIIKHAMTENSVEVDLKPDMTVGNLITYLRTRFNKDVQIAEEGRRLVDRTLIADTKCEELTYIFPTAPELILNFPEMKLSWCFSGRRYTFYAELNGEDLDLAKRENFDRVFTFDPPIENFSFIFVCNPKEIDDSKMEEVEDDSTMAEVENFERAMEELRKIPGLYVHELSNTVYGTYVLNNFLITFPKSAKAEILQITRPIEFIAHEF